MLFFYVCRRTHSAETAASRKAISSSDEEDESSEEFICGGSDELAEAAVGKVGVAFAEDWEAFST